MRAIYIKELRSYFCSVTSYIYLFFFLLGGGYSFARDTLVGGSSDMSGVFSDLSILMILLVPLLTMKLFWSDRRSGVMKQLFSSRATITGIVIGKYFAALTVVAVGLVFSLVYVVILMVFAHPAAGEILLCYIGFALLAAALISIGVFLAALTSRIVTAATSTIAALFCIWSINAILPSIPSGMLRNVLDFFSVFSQLSPWMMGILSLPSVVYFASVAIVFLVLAGAVLDRSRQHRRRYSL